MNIISQEYYKGVSMGMEAQTGKATVQSALPTWFDRIILNLSRVVDPINKYGAYIASVMLFIMMILIFFDVSSRWIFNKPIQGSFELTEYLMAILTSFALGYCALKKHHIRVDLMFQYTSKKTTLWFDVFAYGIAFIFFALINWQCWLNVLSYLNNKLTSAVLFIPAYPFVFIVMVATILLTLVFLRDFLKSIAAVVK
jgi:TRAP-type C4-dicarboxylate transport system permease small subunit